MEFHKRQTPVGPPLKDRIAEADCVAELKAAGFEKTKEWTMLPTQYFLEFRR